VTDGIEPRKGECLSYQESSSSVTTCHFL
jgi:hypothetical protein